MSIKAVVFDAYGTLFDVQSVASVTDEAYPGYGEIVTQIWRLKQLEYSWLRSLMGRYEDFAAITRESLVYTLKLLGLSYEEAVFDRIMDKYVNLDVYPGTFAALEALRGRKLAILSNGSPAMLNDLVRNKGIDRFMEKTISVDSRKIFKPSPAAYTLVEEHLGAKPSETFFVSSNPWDVVGARAAGFTVAWIERVTPDAMAAACVKSDLLPPLTMFKAIRMQMDELGLQPDYRIHGLEVLPSLLT